MDSAFCTEETIQLSLNRKLKSTITAHGRIGWENEVKNITHWTPWVFTEQEIKNSILTGKPLPRVELGYYMYQPGFAKSIRLSKRTHRPFERIPHKKRAEMVKEGKDPRLGLWEHYAVVALMGLHPRTLQEIMEHHQKRASMENLVKEEKINFDLRHFPTKKMKANSAYAILGLIAHNFFRFIAILENPESPPFAKALRRKFVHLPGKYFWTNKQRFVRMSENSYREVMKLKMRWAEIFKPPQFGIGTYDKKAYRRSSLTSPNSS